MPTDPLFYKLLLVVLMLLCLMMHVVWPSEPTRADQTSPKPVQPPRKRSREPKPFAGLTRKPHCDACQQTIAPPSQASCAPPPPIVVTRGRPRTIDTSHHFCPDPACPYYGWVGLGNISANGHPNGAPWRQLCCRQCQGCVLETHGTIFHGKQVAVELIVRVLACLAEGLVLLC